MNKSIVLEIEGPRIAADKFSRGVRTFFDLIEDIAMNVSGKRKSIEWLISVKQGSVAICATAESLNGSQEIVNRTIQAIDNGIKAVGRRAKRPAYFSDNALKKLYELGNITGIDEEGIHHIRIKIDKKINELAPSSVSHIDEILGTPNRAYGTIEGKLQVLSVRNRLNFRVYESLTDKPVTCYFGDEIFSDVIAAIGKRVSAYGLISYRRNGEPVNVEIEELDVFPPEEKLPSWEDMIGILKD
ncbi:MAG: hypothetical protein NTX52_00480 [Planctomycetota bacterium]|nr:hypothetical protein [Planctomycetota bacterium]